jgi:hypothetical protein
MIKIFVFYCFLEILDFFPIYFFCEIAKKKDPGGTRPHPLGPPHNPFAHPSRPVRILYPWGSNTSRVKIF